MLDMRTSERRSLLTCAQQWYWSSVEELRPNRAANPLWFGSAVHVALAEYYQLGFKRGPHPAETFNNFIDGERTMLVTNEDEEREYIDARALGTDMLEHYVEHYGADERWFIIATEHQGRIVLPRPEMKIFGRTRPRLERWLRYHYTWDAVLRDMEDEQVYLGEHKTAASIRTTHLPMDNQAGSYWAVAGYELRKQGVLKKDEEIVGIRYNFLRKAIRDDRPKNADGYYTNKPVKQHYIDALEGLGLQAVEQSSPKSGPIALAKATLADLDAAARFAGLKVFGDVSKSQPPAYFERIDIYRTREERRTQFRRIQDEAVFAEAYRRGYLPITKTPSHDCSWCPFNRMCELDEQGDQASVEVFKETLFHKESPYEVYKVKSTDS